MSREQPPCRRIGRWLKARGLSTAPLTGQDTRALHAFVHLVELFCVADDNGRKAARLSMSFAIQAMQPHTRHLAKATIPLVLDWNAEDRLWSELQPLADAVDDYVGVPRQCCDATLPPSGPPCEQCGCTARTYIVREPRGAS